MPQDFKQPQQNSSPGQPRSSQPEIPSSEPILPAPVGGFDHMKQSRPMAVKKQSSFKKKLWLTLLAGIAFLVIAAVAIATWFYVSLQAPDATAKQKRIIISDGTSLQQVASQLKQEGIIRSAIAFQVYVRLQDIEGDLKAGTYVFSPAQSAQDIAAHLIDGQVDALTVTIIPGQTLSELTDSLMEYGFTKDSIESAYDSDYTHPLLASKPKDSSLEGYIFPDTYEIAGNGTPADLFERSFDAFYERVQLNRTVQKLEQQKLTLHQGIILGSIVQKEVSDTSDQKQVAQVFLKRLRDDIELGSDVTFIYAAQKLGVEPTVGIDSPYNTRKNKGLPPGPIANFNFSALDAVANPAEGEYVYFVAGDDGKTHYARTLEEHEQNVQQHCIELCKLF